MVEMMEQECPKESPKRGKRETGLLNEKTSRDGFLEGRKCEHLQEEHGE